MGMNVLLSSLFVAVFSFNLGTTNGGLYKIGSECHEDDYCDYYISALKFEQEPYFIDGSAFCNDDKECECANGTFHVDGEITCCLTNSSCVGRHTNNPLYTIGGPCDVEVKIQKHAAYGDDLDAACDLHISNGDRLDYIDNSAYCDESTYLCACKPGTSGIEGSKICDNDSGTSGIEGSKICDNDSGTSGIEGSKFCDNDSIARSKSAEKPLFDPCAACKKTGGECVDKDHDGENFTCKCPPGKCPSDVDHPLYSGCDIKCGAGTVGGVCMSDHDLTWSDVSNADKFCDWFIDDGDNRANYDDSAYCDKETFTCKCHPGTEWKLGYWTCIDPDKAVFDPCAACKKTGGECVDEDHDGNDVTCKCPPKKCPSDVDYPLYSGCDINCGDPGINTIGGECLGVYWTSYWLENDPEYMIIYRNDMCDWFVTDDDDTEDYYDNSAHCDNSTWTCQCSPGTVGRKGTRLCRVTPVLPPVGRTDPPIITGPSIKTGPIRPGLPLTFGKQCDPSNASPCTDKSAECVHALDLSARYYCRCKSGYVSISVNDEHLVCYIELTEATDPAGCKHCIDNRGRCYDTDGDNKSDGCICPVTRSTTKYDCDTNHFEVSCDDKTMKVCYKHKNQKHHQGVYTELMSGNAELYIRDYNNHRSCQLKRSKNNHYCLTLSLDGANDCLLTVHKTTDTLKYSSWLELRKSRKSRIILTSYDFCVETSCLFKKMSYIHSGLVEVAAGHEVFGSEGVHVKPQVAMTIRDAQTNDVTFRVLNLGEPIKMRIRITDDYNGLYTSLRAEVCIASDTLWLKLPKARSLHLLFRGCPVGVGPFPSLVFQTMDSQTIESVLFPAPRLGESDNLFIHCAVRVCIDKDECHPYDCDRSRRRSADNQTSDNRTFDNQMSDNWTSDSLIQLLKNPDYKQEVIRLRVRRTQSSTDTNRSSTDTNRSSTDTNRSSTDTNRSSTDTNRLKVDSVERKGRTGRDSAASWDVYTLLIIGGICTIVSVMVILVTCAIVYMGQGTSHKVRIPV